MREQIKIYTDGSCLFNPGGKGGYAAIILFKDQKITIVGSSRTTTNQRMEMQAVIEGLKNVPKWDETEVIIYSDSKYIVDCINQKWYIRWLTGQRWLTYNGTSVKNKDLWQQIFKFLSAQNELIFKYVKAHAGNKYNEKVDILAREAAKEQSEKKVMRRKK